MPRAPWTPEHRAAYEESIRRRQAGLPPLVKSTRSRPRPPTPPASVAPTIDPDKLAAAVAARSSRAIGAAMVELLAASDQRDNQVLDALSGIRSTVLRLETGLALLTSHLDPDRERLAPKVALPAAAVPPDDKLVLAMVGLAKKLDRAMAAPTFECVHHEEILDRLNQLLARPAHVIEVRTESRPSNLTANRRRG